MKRPTQVSLKQLAQRGFTLIEMTVTMAILTVVLGVLFAIMASITDASIVQDAKVTTSEQARGGMQLIMRELRQASRRTLTGLPGESIAYRIPFPTDLDLDNDLPVDRNGRIELGTVHVIKRDVDDANCTADANEDGLMESQVVLVTLDATGAVIQDGADKPRVLANNVPLNEDANRNGVLDSGEDINNNGRLDQGIWFVRGGELGQLVQITIQSRGESRQGNEILSTLSQFVLPRNG